MRILIGVDGSDASATACHLVADRSWPLGTEARLVAVVESSGGLGARPRESEARCIELAAILDHLAEPLRRRGIPCEIAVEGGRPAEALIGAAADWWADLIVVGSRGRGAAASALFGSVSAHLVDHAPCPVLVARAPGVTRMLVATDGSRSSLDVPRMLARWRPAFHGLDVEVLSISPGEAAQAVVPEAELLDRDLAEHRRIAEEVAEEMGELGWAAAAVARAGDPSREIVEAAEGYGADLIVTGSRCLGTLARLLAGSVAHAVLLGTRASVLVMRGAVPARTTAERRVGALAGA